MAYANIRPQAGSVRGGTPVGAGTADRFRRAVEAGDHDTIRGLFAEDVTLFGPVVPEPVRGIRDAGAVLWAALSRFDDIRYLGQFGGRIGRGDGAAGVETHMLRFRAELNGNEIDGIDVLELDEKGLICTLTVLFRPLDWLAGTGFAGRRRPRR
jgi:hypothetical protein